RGERGHPCTARPRHCRPAQCPHRYSPPTRSPRHAARTAGPHRSHVSVISRHLPVRGRAQVPSPPHCYPACCTVLIAHPVTSAPSLAATAATGTPLGPELIRTAPVIVAAPRRRSTPAAGSASSAAGFVMRTPAASPHQYGAAASPA